MKLIYLANIRIPTEKAHGIQVMQMCQAFNDLGQSVELVIAKRNNAQFAGVDPFSYYQIARRFPIKRLPLIDMVETRRSFGGLSVIIQNTSFAITAFMYLVRRPFDILYSRDQFSLFLLSFFRPNLVWEMHEFPRSNRALYRWLMQRLKAVVVITHGLKELVVAQGIPAEKVLVAPDGVNLDQFTIGEDQQQCRQKLGLPADKRLVVYTGHLWRWKGVYVLVEAASLLPDDCLIVFVGGMEHDLNELKRFAADRGATNIFFAGYQPPATIPYWLKAADCLVLPNSGQQEISRRYTSPIKLFEYMAAQRPIVASKLPSIEEILTEQSAIIVEPDDPKALALGIKQALQNSDFSAIIVTRAFSMVGHFTWQERARHLLTTIVSV